jgi:hypothetical protein
LRAIRRFLHSFNRESEASTEARESRGASAISLA